MAYKKNILDARKIAKIRRSVERRKSVFSDMRFLDTLYLPTDIIGRENEAEQLIRYFVNLQKGLQTPFISVYGRSGSGKTTVVKYVCSQMSDVLASIFVNLRKSRTVFGCANTILSELGGESIKKAFGVEKVVDRIHLRIEHILEQNHKHMLVVVLDEYDVMFSDKRGNPSDFVYKLLRIAETLREKSLYLCIITISNNTINEYDLDDRVKSRIGNESVFFVPYSKDDIVYILNDRIPRAFSINISDSVIQYAASLCSADHGDARRALDMFRIAGNICNGKITKKNIDDSFEKMQGRKISEILSRLPQSSKHVFFALARISHITDKKWHSTTDLYNQYLKFAADKNHTLRYRRVFDILAELEQQGILNSKSESRGRQGFSRQYCLTIPIAVLDEIIPESVSKWNKIRDQRFEFLHKPVGTRNDVKHARYEDKKIWRNLTGMD